MILVQYSEGERSEEKKATPSTNIPLFSLQKSVQKVVAEQVA